METGNLQLLEGTTETVYFNDWSDSHSYGGVFKITRITGGDGASIRSPNEVRPQRDGGLLHPFYRGTRVATIEGEIVPNTREARADMEDLLRSVTQSILRTDGSWRYLPSNATGTTDPDDYREIIPRLLEPVEILTQDSAIKTFTIPLIAESPYARSLGTHSDYYDIASGASTTITNAGNAPYWPLIKVYGPAATFTISNGNTDPDDPFAASESIVHWDGLGHTVTNGDFLHCLMDFERLYRDSDGGSELRYVDFSETDFFPLWKGDNEISFDASGIGGATKIRVYAYDGWVA